MRRGFGLRVLIRLRGDCRLLGRNVVFVGRLIASRAVVEALGYFRIVCGCVGLFGTDFFSVGPFEGVVRTFVRFTLLACAVFSRAVTLNVIMNIVQLASSRVKRAKRLNDIVGCICREARMLPVDRPVLLLALSGNHGELIVLGVCPVGALCCSRLSKSPHCLSGFDSPLIPGYHCMPGPT